MPIIKTSECCSQGRAFFASSSDQFSTDELIPQLDGKVGVRTRELRAALKVEGGHARLEVNLNIPKEELDQGANLIYSNSRYA